jgi:hypothetical protein
VTPVAQLAAEFENGCCHDQEIYLARLLGACHAFAAAMRRVGQTQSAKDLMQNLQKVEELLLEDGSSSTANPQQQQTMSSWLRYEKEVLAVHGGARCGGTKNNAKLKDPSGAIGLLWIRRSIEFNCHFYSLVVGADDDSPTYTPAEAALAAYRKVLQPVHSWTWRRLYTIGIQSATPDRNDFLARVGGFDGFMDGGKSVHVVLTPQQERAAIRDLRRLVAAWLPLIDSWKQTFQNLDLEDKRLV